MGIKTALLKHQAECVELVKNKTFYALLLQPGLGKTLTALAIIDERKSRFKKYPTLYVCPNTLVENVMEEASLRTDITCVALRGSRSRRSALLEAHADVYIMNYEGTRIMTDELICKRFQCVIFDESHATKCHTSQQSKACYRIAMSIPHRIIMTGTAIMNSPLDVFGQYRLLSNDIFGTSYYKFRARYAIMGGFLNKQVTKYINLDTFKQRMLSCSIVKTKEDCLDLPPRMYETVHVDLSEEQMKMYRDLKDQFLASYKGEVVTAPVMLTRIMRFSQITAGFFKNTEGKEISFEKNPKLDFTVDWIKTNPYKVIVFVRFIKEREDLEARLTSEGIAYVAIKQEDDDRVALVKKFNQSPEIQVFVTSISIGGQGLNLQSASYCIFLSNEYSFGKRDQAESRTHRQNQTADKCTYIDVVARNTIDENILKILKKKESLASIITTDIGKIL